MQEVEKTVSLLDYEIKCNEANFYKKLLYSKGVKLTSVV